jgi:hypothetical protein
MNPVHVVHPEAHESRCEQLESQPEGVPLRCRQPGRHKIVELTRTNDRPPFTRLLCCGHFWNVMGPTAEECCQDAANSQGGGGLPPHPCPRCGQPSLTGNGWICARCRESCLHEPRRLSKLRANNGHLHFFYQCLTCGAHLQNVEAADIENPMEIPLRISSFESELPRACARCGTLTGSEEHHWAPRAIFGMWSADQWPTSWLCPACHQEWHGMMARAKGRRIDGANDNDPLRPDWARHQKDELPPAE